MNLDHAEPQVRTFRGPTPRSALAAVKLAFGKDAVILSSREVSGGLLKPKEIEIVARREPPPPAEKPAKAAAEGTQLSSSAASKVLRFHAAQRAQAQASEGATPSLTELPAAWARPAYEATPAAPLAEAGGRTQLLARLVDRGIDEGLATGLLDDAYRQLGGRMAPRERLARTVRSVCSVVRAPWSPDPAGGRSVVALVGPTGVGKTTTIAKIAARAVTDFALKVSLITIDTYRIGAIEQLARYGELMGIGTHVARDRFALADALAHTADADLVLIDTAGRSPSDTAAIEQQAELLRSAPGVELHLAVTAGTTPRQMRMIRERYRSMRPERVIVTKLDEAVGNASVFNITSQVNAPLSCVTNGQRVPDDLSAPAVGTIVEWVVGS